MSVMQEAKQFAAEQALRYLYDNPNISTSNVPLVSPPEEKTRLNTQPEPKRLKMGDNLVEAGIASTAENPTPLTSDSEPASSTSGVRNEANVTELVSELIRTLRLKNLRYDVKDDESQPGFFRGSANFDKEPLAPSQPFTVSGATGKKQAKEQLAAQAFEWLQELQSTRMKAFEAANGEAQ
jgi:hypothetical protein